VHPLACTSVLLDWLCFWRPPCRLRRVIVNLTYSQTEALQGVLWSYRGGWITLRDVSGVSGGSVTHIDGDVVVHRNQVAYYQVLSTETRMPA
jgi:hypothetical protein